MQTDSLIVGLIVLLLCGATCFYLYIRLSYVEKKMSMLESLTLDVKMGLDSFMNESQFANQGQPMPISPSVMNTLSAPVALGSSEAEVVPEEEFYSSVLAQATEDASGSTAVVQPFTEAEDVAAAPVAAAAEPSAVAPSSGGPDYESMTRPEVQKLAEERGLRVRKNMSKGEMVSVLRRSDAAQNQPTETGAENVSGSAGAVFQTGASLDGDYSVDLGQSGATLEVSA
jgi:hypothetical protein